MLASSSIDLEQDPRVINEYHADKGTEQTLARLADYVAQSREGRVA